jgi:hypothetical protein
MNFNFERFYIADKIVEYLNGLIDFDEIEEWLKSSDQNKRVFESVVAKIAEGESLLFDPQQIKADKEAVQQVWQRIENRLGKKAPHTHRFRILYGSVAACACIIIGLITFQQFPKPDIHPKGLLSSELPAEIAEFRLIMSDNRVILLEEGQDEVLSEETGMQIYKKADYIDYSSSFPRTFRKASPVNRIEVPRGKDYRIRLNDKTLVHLNAESILSYPASFNGDIREVELIGEAYFQVTEDERPFVVKSIYGDIRVLGTEFNILAYLSDQYMETTLTKGSIEINMAGHNPVLLEPSQQIRYNATENSLDIEKVDPDLYSSWKENQIVFKDRSLAYIMNYLSHWYDIEVSWEDPSLKEILFGCKLNKPDNVESIIRLLEGTQHVNFEIEGNKIHVNHGEKSTEPK